MKSLHIDPSDPDPQAIEEAAHVLRQGGLIVYPTDTCYGIGADSRNERAMTRISELKGRADQQKYSVIAKDIDHIESLTLLSLHAREIVSAYLPGPYTFVLLNIDFTVAQTSTLGVRIPDYAVTREIAEAFGDAYITTSANQAGLGAIYSIEQLNQEFLAEVDENLWPDLVLDAGPLTERAPSTVVDLTQDPPYIIRDGGHQFTWPRELA